MGMTIAPLTSDEPRILICRLGAVGDCILTMPMLCALRDRYPNAFLAWVVEHGPESLLEDHPCLDRLIVVSAGCFRSPGQLLELRGNLKELKFDLTIDPQSKLTSALAARLSGAPQRVGIERSRGWGAWLNNWRVKPAACDAWGCQVEVLRGLGIDSFGAEFRLPLQPEAERRIDNFIRNAHLQCRFAVMSPGAGCQSRRWTPELYGKVARNLGHRRQVPTVVAWKGDDEFELAKRVVAASGGHALPAPSTTLPELAVLLNRASLFVGSNAAPLHLASAVGTPSIGLFRSQTSRPADLAGLDAHFAEQGLEAIQVDEVSESTIRRLDGSATLARAA